MFFVHECGIMDRSRPVSRGFSFSTVDICRLSVYNQFRFVLHSFYFEQSFFFSFLGPLVPLFWISGDVSPGFQSQSGFCLIRYFCGGECNVHSPRFTSGATPADLLTPSMVISHFPTCISRGRSWLGIKRASPTVFIFQQI